MIKRVWKSVPVSRDEITPEKLYFSRRDFIKAAGLAGGAALLAACTPSADRERGPEATVPPDITTSSETDELGDPLTPYESIISYNNFYEFGLEKDAPSMYAYRLTTEPWDVEVAGLVSKPGVFAVNDLIDSYPQEERIYRLRCVEGWSMVIPWLGFRLADLLKAVEPTPEAKFVAFTSVYRPQEMPGQESSYFPWPYTEGLRLDEAMHDLTILATGLYGQPLPKQDGAPIRLVVPWKYGFKSIKSIVKIELVSEMPTTLWNTTAPNEYGFYSNVNPDVAHPRWSQASERRIGETARRETLMFNGYAEEVAGLYEGMDLRENY